MLYFLGPLAVSVWMFSSFWLLGYLTDSLHLDGAFAFAVVLSYSLFHMGFWAYLLERWIE